MRALLTLLFLVCMTGICQAKTEYRFTTGDCDGSSVGWWCTSRYDNGRLVESWGVDCNGREYHRFGRAVTISSPLLGNPTEVGVCDGTPAGGAWFAVTTRNQGGAPTAVWGRDCTGTYWQFVADPASVSQGTPSAAPAATGERDIR